MDPYELKAEFGDRLGDHLFAGHPEAVLLLEKRVVHLPRGEGILGAGAFHGSLG